VTDNKAHHDDMNTPSLRDTSRNTVAGLTLLFAAGYFLVAEYLTAAAWHHPSYSYKNDFVSDLGITDHHVMFGGHPVNSPLAWLLNSAFFLNGAAVALAALLVLRPQGHGRSAGWQRRLFVGFGIGLPLASIMHETPSWKFPFHAVGATLAMAGGSIAIFLTGRLADRLDLPTWLARALMALGAVGLASFLVVQVMAFGHPVLPNGIGAVERGAAYAVMLAEIVVGSSLLVESARLRRRSLPHDASAVTIAA